jgi:hypothetical protein
VKRTHLPLKDISPSTLLSVALIGLALCLPGAAASSSSQKSFATAEAAAQALLAAAEADDVAALLLIFGPSGKQVLSAGDPVQDKKHRAAFVEKAKKSMKLEKDPTNPNRVLIAIGEDDFPFPIPLTKAPDNQWRFDIDEGKFEVLARRIGSNELDAIAVCSGYVESQFKYAEEDHNNNNVREYAQRFVSSPGKQDGLYSPDAPNALASPISIRIKEAAAEGYTKEGDKPVPYHGYYFKILKGQGPNAAGGANDYLQRGLMIGGFALIAWPSEYGSSGIKTFQVNQDDIIYEKDLGPGTAKVAQAITKFNPDKTWRVLR